MINYIKKKVNRKLNKINFKKFQKNINLSTKLHHDEILDWAENYSQKEEIEDSEIVEKGLLLRDEAIQNFKDLKKSAGLKILIHLPSKIASPGGHSLFTNFAEAFEHIGVETALLELGNPIEAILDDFNPNILLTSDHEMYLKELNWNYINEYKKSNNFKIGLTASLEEYGNTSLKSRLDWSSKNPVDFYYSFMAKEHFSTKADYRPFFDKGYEIISIEFGANPFYYYPVGGIKKDLDYVFLASSNQDKWERYFDYLSNILKDYSGFLDGPGWEFSDRWSAKDVHNVLYSRAKVGINLHIPYSIDWPSELNERTYILASCGVPQLVDNAKLLHKRFSKKSLVIAKNPKEYEELFRELINNENLGKNFALNALDEVYEKHTTFHRVVNFIDEFKALYG